MTAIEQIRVAQNTALVAEDFGEISVALTPPLKLEEIEALQERIGSLLPAELRAVLQFCSGIDGCLDGIDFTGASMSFEHKEIFPYGLPIARDGFGNFWVIDITPHATDVAPIFYACHDAPVILYQSRDLASFLTEVFRIYIPPHQSLVEDVPNDRMFEVWRKNPGVISLSDATVSTDPVIRSFASRLSERFQIVDLRSVSPGMGFSWGRYGPHTEILRNGFERVFAYAKPLRKRFLGKLFDR